MTAHATFRFYGPLNEFLPVHARGAETVRAFDGHPAVKDTIEAIGAPHPEIQLVLVNGEPSGLERPLHDGDRVAVFPRFRSIDISGVRTVGVPPPACPRFALDTHLGRLAAYLRMLGFDTLYRNDFGDEELARISSGEERILLTKDRGLLKRALVRHGHYVRATDPRVQAVEILTEYDLVGRVRSFTRCMHCNGLLQAADADAVREHVPPSLQARDDGFTTCPDCARVYWLGSHVRQMQFLIEWMLEAAGG